MSQPLRAAQATLLAVLFAFSPTALADTDPEVHSTTRYSPAMNGNLERIARHHEVGS